MSFNPIDLLRMMGALPQTRATMGQLRGNDQNGITGQPLTLQNQPDTGTDLSSDAPPMGQPQQIPQQIPTNQAQPGPNQAQPSPMDALIQKLTGRTPDVMQGEALDRMGMGAHTNKYLKLMNSFAELGNGFVTGLHHQQYRTPQQRAYDEALKEYQVTAPTLDKLLSLKSLDQNRQATIDIKKQHENSYLQMAQDRGLHYKNMDEARNDINKANISYKDAQTKLAQGKTLTDEETRKMLEAKTKLINTQNIMEGLPKNEYTSAWFEATNPTNLEPDTFKKFNQNVKQLEKYKKEGKTDPLHMNLKMDSEFWNPETRQIENKPRGYMYRSNSGGMQFVGDPTAKVLDTEQRKALNAGVQAENTTTGLVSTLADAYTNGTIKNFKGPFNGTEFAKTLRRLGFSDPYLTDEALSGVLTPTGMLQHMRQLTGGRVSDTQLKHFQSSLGIENPSTPEAAIRNAVALKLATQHGNNVIGGSVGAAAYDPKMAATIRKETDAFMSKLKLSSMIPGMAAPEAPDIRGVHAKTQELQNETPAPAPKSLPSGFSVTPRK